MRRLTIWSAAAMACALLAPTAPALAETGSAAAIDTNQRRIEELMRAPAFDAADALATFSFVLSQLAAEVEIYPTENYYYFELSHRGVRWGGNIRLDPRDRNAGKIHFSYHQARAEWSGKGRQRFIVLGPEQGVGVERVGRLAYRVSQGARSVVFRLNDLAHVKPPATALALGERFIGPIQDESALRFFLIFNTKAKLFHYVLDETQPVPDELTAMPRAARILVGRRTGFAFYRDHRHDRKILVGVSEREVRLNTWLDGPFDQLPENFIEGEALREAIVASDPEAKGRIDRLGNFTSGEGRYLIEPYKLYRRTSDLLAIDTCAMRQRGQVESYARCFLAQP